MHPSFSHAVLLKHALFSALLTLRIILHYTEGDGGVISLLNTFWDTQV